MSRAELRGQLEQYYKESDVKYLNWGRDEEREGIYALHCGFHIKGKDQTHYEEIKEKLSKRGGCVLFGSRLSTFRF